MKSTTKIEKIIPYILAILMPGLSFFNNNSFLEQYPALELLPTWFSTSIILIILWYTNEWVSNRNVKPFYLIAIILNVVFVMLFILIISLYLPDDFKSSVPMSWTRGLRLLFASAIFITIQQSLKSARTVEHLKSENLLLKAENYKAELDQLRKQVNPHFLFNSLSTLQTMIRNSHQNSENFLKNLSSFYRQMLQTRNRDYVSVEEEIQYLDSYLYLMKMRHENALEIKIDVNPKSLQHSVPIFALQLLVENCIKHNIVAVGKPLFIHIYQKDEVTMTISNNYQPKNQSVNSEGLGLSNLLDRYKLMGIDRGMEIEKSDSHYNVTIKLF